MNDAEEYFSNIKNKSSNGYSISNTTVSSLDGSPQIKWYDNNDWQNKLIYKIEKSIPGVVQRILEEMGFIEWDENEHEQD